MFIHKPCKMQNDTRNFQSHYNGQQTFMVLVFSYISKKFRILKQRIFFCSLQGAFYFFSKMLAIFVKLSYVLPLQVTNL